MSPLIPDEDENFGGSLVLDFRKRDENDLLSCLVPSLTFVFVHG